jgi:predicted enzyme related to lactoylglutathione lyase
MPVARIGRNGQNHCFAYIFSSSEERPMRMIQSLTLSVALLAAGSIGLSLLPAAPVQARTAASDFAMGAQYDTTHVYVAPEDFDRFVASLVATFGGTTSKQGVFTVTPTPSSTMSQLVLTPAGTLSVFGFKTPVPWPFGAERTGYLVSDMDAAVTAARKAGADVLVKTFPDPIGRDVVIQWPGGVDMQLYWHTTVPSYPALQTVPENRVYVSADRLGAFVRSFLVFSHGKVVSDDTRAPGNEIGRPDDTYRRVRIESSFGKLTVLVTDGHLPWPYGRETTGYEVADLAATLDKAKAAGATVLVDAHVADRRNAAMVQFPGGYIAEIHSPPAR